MTTTRTDRTGSGGEQGHDRRSDADHSRHHHDHERPPRWPQRAAVRASPPADLSLELEEASAVGYASRDRADMAPTIAYFESLITVHPGHPVLTFEVAGAYDAARRESEAAAGYEEALRLGFSGEYLRRCLCQYGSMPRRPDRLDE